MKTDTRRETQKEDFSSFVALFHLQELEGKSLNPNFKDFIVRNAVLLFVIYDGQM